jgi:hypothetical protein
MQQVKLSYASLPPARSATIVRYYAKLRLPSIWDIRNSGSSPFTIGKSNERIKGIARVRLLPGGTARFMVLERYRDSEPATAR